MKRYFLLILVIIECLSGHAQEDERMETDRPNESEIAPLVPRKFLQFETGIYLERISQTDDKVQHPILLLRYGLSKIVELRLQTKLTTSIKYHPLKDIATTGLEPVELGIKLAISEQHNWLPQTSFVFQTGIPLASKSFKTKHLSPEFRLLMENKITEKFSLTYNAGAEWDGFETEPTWLYTFTPTLDIGKHWNTFVELFSFFKRKEAPEHTLDGGVEFFINKNLSVDICSGLGLNKAASHFFITAGGAVRFR